MASSKEYHEIRCGHDAECGCRTARSEEKEVITYKKNDGKDKVDRFEILKEILLHFVKGDIGQWRTKLC